MQAPTSILTSVIWAMRFFERERRSSRSNTGVSPAKYSASISAPCCTLMEMSLSHLPPTIHPSATPEMRPYQRLCARVPATATSNPDPTVMDDRMTFKLGPSPLIEDQNAATVGPRNALRSRESTDLFPRRSLAP